MCVSTVNCLSRGRGPGCRCPASRPPHPMAAAVHLRSLHSLAHRPPAAKAAPRWLPLPARPGARRRGSRLALLVCSASSPAPASPSSSGGDNGASAAARWAEWIPRAADGRAGAGPEQVLRLISGAAATPVCQFVDKPRTFLHSVDPRVKLVWLGPCCLTGQVKHIYAIWFGSIPGSSFSVGFAKSCMEGSTWKGCSPFRIHIHNAGIWCRWCAFISSDENSSPFCSRHTKDSLLHKWVFLHNHETGTTTIYKERPISSKYFSKSLVRGPQLSSGDCSTPDKLEKANGYGDYRSFFQLYPANIQKYI